MVIKNACPPKLRSCWRGFTLAELLITGSLLTIMGLTALVGLNPMLQILRGYDTRRKADLFQIKTAFESYYTDHDCYPSKDILKNCGSSDLAPYLATIPCDPSSKQPYPIYFGADESESCPQKFSIYAQISNTKDPDGNLITYCPNTIAQTSVNALFTDTVAGCSGQEICQNLYGCRGGACVLLFLDTTPTCGFTYCTSDCNAINCAKKNARGIYVNECR